MLEAGEDARNYGGLQGIAEARALYAPILGVPPSQVVVGDNFTFGRKAAGDVAKLAELGITRATPDPIGGSIGRDPHGEPDGMLWETAAVQYAWAQRDAGC